MFYRPGPDPPFPKVQDQSLIFLQSSCVYLLLFQFYARSLVCVHGLLNIGYTYLARRSVLLSRFLMHLGSTLKSKNCK